MDPVSACVLRALLVLGVLRPAASVPCPRLCSCPQPAELHCTFRSLFSVPAAVSKDVKRVNLGFNSIQEISDSSLAGLGKLELLMLHGNDIHSLPDGAFRDLHALQMLKISYNKLKEINRHTLRGLWALARLHLDHNQLGVIHPDSFHGLTSLRLLQLEGNRLRQLHPATFATFTLMDVFHVSTLRHLYLSDNGLTSLPSGLLATMPQLENLYLHGNPWTCDCNMRWFHGWDEASPGVLKCKKDRALPGGQLCPLCSSPRHIQGKELQAMENLVCSSPTISSPQRASLPGDTESEVLTVEAFSEPFGNVSLGLSDEHGNEVDLECGVGEPGELAKVSWEQVSQLQLASNITLSMDLECAVDRGTYERLWRLIAYYSSVPAHLKRGVTLREEPNLTYAYKQDSERDAQYYTGVKVNLKAQPAWLMQAAVDLQLNRLQSSAKSVRLTLGTELAETAEVELVRGQRRSWVAIESTNTTRKVFSAVVGRQSEMHCDVRSSGQRVVQWMLPDGSKLEAPHGGPDSRVSASSGGRLVIKAVRHTDAGIYYCIAKVHRDLAVLPFHLTVQESSAPPPGEDASVAAVEGFVGGPISLPCRTSGSPDAEINWILPSGNIVSLQDNSSRALVYANGTLHIPQTQLLDSGHYKCVAINQHGVDTLATKVNLVRRKGGIRPLRKFPARPQSASGVNTNVPIQDAEEASGDFEDTEAGAPVNHGDPVRKRIPGGVATGRRGVHPSRTMRRRPPLLRKPTGSHVADTKNTVESRRRINVSKSKIDPEKWADILAKIRDRNGQSTATPPLPGRQSTVRKVTEPTRQPQNTADVSSDGGTVQEKEAQQHLKPHTSIRNTQTKPLKRGRGSASKRRPAQSSDAAAAPQTTQPPHRAPHTTPDSDRHAASNGAFFLPQTTSAPRHAVTFWQSSANAASSGSASARPESRSVNGDIDGVKAADWSTATERSGSTNGAFVASSDTEGELSLSGSQIQPPVDRDEPEPSHEATAASRSETAVGDLPSHAIHTTESAAAATEPTAAKRRGSERKAKSKRKNQESKRKNGGRRRRPNKRGKKLLKTNPIDATAPATDAPETARATVSSRIDMEPLQSTTVLFSTAGPESTVSRQPTSTPGATSPLPPAKPPRLASTSAATAFPTASPGVGRGQTSTQPTSGASGSASAAVFTAATRRSFTRSFTPPVQPTETRGVGAADGLGLVPLSTISSGGFHTATQVQTDAGPNQLGHQHTPTEKGPSNEGVSLPPSPSASAAAIIERELRTPSGTTSRNPIKTQSPPFQAGLDPGQVSTNEPETLRRSFNQSETTSSERRGETASAEINEDAATKSTETTTGASATSWGSDAVIPSTVAPHATLSNSSPTAANMGRSPWTTNPPDDQSEDQQIQSIATSGPRRTSESYPETRPTVRSLTPFTSVGATFPGPQTTSRQAVEPTVSLAPTAAASQTESLTEGPLTSTRDASRKLQLPGPGPASKGRPRIAKEKFRTFAVKAGADFQLPCEAEGEPTPFLSWTKVAGGASIAQNTRVQRLEVHPNGTLIIRNTQPMDGGQYLCRVQNQHGTDEMLVNLEVLSQHPRILQPRQRDAAIDLGGKVDLECTAEGLPLPRVTWVLPSRAHMAAPPHGAAPHQRVSVLTNGTLRINQAIYADRGVYKCVGSSAAGSDAVSVHLRVSASPPVIQQTRNENATFPEGSVAAMHCTATGAPQPVIRWTTPDGLQLTASGFVTGRNLVVFPNGTLYIQGLGLGHGGTYECLASNVVASSRRAVTLSIRRSPSFAKASVVSSSPQRTDVIYGGRLLLNCVAAGAPEPRIIWRTPSKKLVDSQYSFDPRIKVFPNGTIAVHSVTDKDGGDYLCVARNKMGDDYLLLRVNVLTRPAKIKQRQQQSSQEVMYGGDLKVDCVASGLPNPEISWALPDGTMVNPVKQRDVSGGRSRRYVVFDNGTLYFNDVGMPEEGDYTCYAENQLGKDEMKVRVKVKLVTSPPPIQDGALKVVRTFYGDTVTLRCDARGKSVTWISPTNSVISPALEKYQVLDDGTLVIQKVQRFDGGDYTCLARSSAGQDRTVIRLEVRVTSPVINGLNGTANTIKVTAVPDQQKFVDCVAKGTPTPRIMWVLPGNVILPVPYYSNRMAVHQNGTLEIRSVKRTDSGRLVCIARNDGGEVRLLVDLAVKEVVERPPIGAPKTDRLSLSVGNAMTLNCSFEGSTQPHVTWILPSGTPLHSGARFAKFFHRSDGSLIIGNPSVAEAGTYRCLGRTFRGVSERSVTLTPGRKPEINNRYNSPVSVMNGERLFLHCVTSGEPPRLTWTLPSGVVLSRPQRAGRYAVLPNGTLAIQQVSVYDRGLYVCRAANEYGSSAMSLSVTVIAYPPRITSAPPSVTYAKRGVAIQLNCMATGTPKVNMAWVTPDKTRLAVSGQPRLFGNKYLHPQGSLVIQNPTQRDAGVYRCTARNAIGTDSKTTFLNVF